MKELTDLQIEAKRFRNIVLEWNEFTNQERWDLIFNNTLEVIKNTFEESKNASKRRKALTELMYFFAPRMGSFSEDAPKDLIEVASKIHVCLHKLLRKLWKDEGNETHHVNDHELFSVGDYVNLINGKLMSIHFNGYKTYADFVERHDYEIKKPVEADISNMPQYVIQYQQHIDVVRHDALT